MAIRRFFPNIAIPVAAVNSSAAAKNSQAMTGGPALTNRHVQLQTAPNSLKRFNPVNKVFEDEENGVVCYRDEQGKLICEGYDEGPRFSWYQDEEKLEELRKIDRGYESMKLSTEALIVMMEQKRLNTGKMISS